MESTRTIRYGIIGFGYFAEKAIAPAIVKSAQSSLVAIQKRSLAAANEKAALYNIPKAFDSVEALVADSGIDAVFIGSANCTHCPETVIAARAGKHVLVEKPMAMNVMEAQQMVDVCRERNVRLAVGHMLRLSPLVMRMRQIVKEGRIGSLVRAHAEYFFNASTSQRRWIYDRKVAGGGPVFDIGVHCLDTLRYVLDDEVTVVSSTLDPTPTAERTESIAQLALKFSRGTVGSVYCSFVAPFRHSTIVIMGDKGVLSARDFTSSNRTLRLSITLNGEAPEEHSEDIVVPDLYKEEIEMFTNSILGNTETPLLGQNGLENQKILDTALQTHQ
ncbi:MAG: Gfo/Idh/MocA family oxidoreductase [Ignavibacteria bacterium]|nr:Gfo/Idh/MocA family oxidoreductase [Ignavibacteria bacterium]